MSALLKLLIRYFLIMILTDNLQGQLLRSGKPIFQLSSWIEVDDYEWKSNDDLDAGLYYNDSLLIVPGDISGIILECNATYPVEISFEMFDVESEDFTHLFSTFTRARREARSVDDQLSYQYSMKYQIIASSNQNTGFYVCQGTTNPKYQSRIYVMWEGNSPPYLIGAKRTITVSTYKKKEIVLPCRVSAPDIDVLLEKEINRTKDNNETILEFVTIGVNESIIYDATFGFLLKLGQMSDIEGTYKCSTFEIDDEMYINVTSEPEESSTEETTIRHTTQGSHIATLSYEPNENSMVCCSNSDIPPKLMFFGCPTATLCKMLRNLIKKKAHVFAQFHTYNTNTNNCSRQYVYGYSGVAVCKGDGIDISVETFFSVDRYVNGSHLRDIYLEWSHANTENMLSIQAVTVNTYYYNDYGRKHSFNHEIPLPSETQMYQGQNISFRCETSPYYFATGIKWQIQWKNTSKQFLDSSDITDINTYMYYWIQPNPLSLIVHSEMEAIVCYAPVWNSSEWIQKKFNLNIAEPIPPTVHITPTESELYWTLNETEKIIDCRSEGEPKPEMFWTKHGFPLDSDRNMLVQTPEEGVLRLKFQIATYDVHGDYTCISHNLAGTFEKTISIMVEEPHPWVATIVITLVVLSLLIVIGFIGWRIKVQRNMAEGIIRRTA